MTKNELIAKLQSIKGNPQITVWNGFVGDYQNIGLVDEMYLYKENPDFRIEGINFQRKRQNQPELTEEEVAELKKDLSKQEYELPNQFVELSEYKRWYNKKKKIVCIEPKPRGKSSWDRLGGIDY